MKSYFSIANNILPNRLWLKVQSHFISKTNAFFQENLFWFKKTGAFFSGSGGSRIFSLKCQVKTIKCNDEQQKKNLKRNIEISYINVKSIQNLIWPNAFISSAFLHAQIFSTFTSCYCSCGNPINSKYQSCYHIRNFSLYLTPNIFQFSLIPEYR